METTTPNPFDRLLRSRRFWMLVLDTVVSVALRFLAGDDAQFLVAALQPIFIVIVVSFTIEDREAIRAGAQVESTRLFHK